MEIKTFIDTIAFVLKTEFNMNDSYSSGGRCSEVAEAVRYAASVYKFDSKILDCEVTDEAYGTELGHNMTEVDGWILDFAYSQFNQEVEFPLVIPPNSSRGDKLYIDIKPADESWDWNKNAIQMMLNPDSIVYKIMEALQNAE